MTKATLAAFAERLSSAEWPGSGQIKMT
ncbi:hypothetical protein MNBD_ALPHA12-1426, partial [hydrothermal vent metagenome]